MLIAQISDLHVQPEPGPGSDFDTRASLANVVAAIQALDSPPDFIIATGDLVNDGTDAEYAVLRETLAPLTAPLLLIPGNHDARGPLKSAFRDHDYLPRGGDRLSYALEHNGRRLIGLDTLVEGQDPGRLGDKQLSWLGETLRANTAPTLIFLHHPPFLTGIPGFDRIGLTDGDGLRAVVSRHKHVAGVLAGHVHRTITAPFAHTSATIALSTCFAYYTSLAGAPLRRRMEQPGFMLHWWPDDGRLVSHAISLPVAAKDSPTV